MSHGLGEVFGESHWEMPVRVYHYVKEAMNIHVIIVKSHTYTGWTVRVSLSGRKHIGGIESWANVRALARQSTR